MKLHEKLYGIAQGAFYSESALYEAIQHPVTTCNDKQMLRRYLYGGNSSSDRFELHELANYICGYERRKP